MPTERWVVVCAGGHARVVMDALLRQGLDPERLAFVDDDTALRGTTLLGVSVLGAASEWIHPDVRFHVAVGSNRAREALHRLCLGRGASPFDVVHPTASVSTHATIGHGSFVAASAVVAPAATVGVGVIVNHGAVVDHDCVVGDFVHIAPGATLAGRVTVGRGVLVGAGANVLPGISIGEDAVVGAGAVVVGNVPPKAVVVGVPARMQGRLQS